MRLKDIAKVASEIFGELDAPMQEFQRVCSHGVLVKKADIAFTKLKDIYNTQRYRCIQCGTAQHDAMDYMVKHGLWAAAVGYENVTVCMPCLEAELGRDLELSDLLRAEDGRSLPINARAESMFALKGGSLIVDNEAERAKITRENEDYYADLVRKKLSIDQLELLAAEEAKANPPKAGYHSGKRKKN